MIQDSEHSPGATLVVCDDGTAWFLYGGEWVETTPIPGTRAGCEPHLHPRPPVEKGIYDADDDPIPF